MNNETHHNKLSYSEAAKFLGLAEITVRTLVMRRALRFSKLGKRVLFEQKDLQAYFDSRAVPPRSLQNQQGGSHE